jgi:hypothetical protein
MRTREGSSPKWVIAAGLLLLSQASRAGAASENQPAPAPQPCPPATATLATSAQLLVVDCVPAWVIDAFGVRRLPDRCSTADADAIDAAPTTPSAGAALPTALDRCDPPVFVDTKGILRIRPACLESTSTLSAPTPPSVSAATSTPSPPPTVADDAACDSPTFVDAKGIRRIRLSCLESNREVPSTAAAPTILPAAGAGDSPTTDCSPAYWIDANGIRRLRPRCL